jgi:hypothetical protein
MIEQMERDPLIRIENIDRKRSHPEPGDLTTMQLLGGVGFLWLILSAVFEAVPTLDVCRCSLFRLFG